VRVLGPIEVSGAARTFTRAWALELVVYLSMHPRGVSNERWATALWPDRVMAPASLHSTASAARRSLGSDPSGDDLLPRARGRLALSEGVQTDWDRFNTLARSDRPANWKGALALIRGRPFEGLRSPDWVVLEGIAATVEAVAVDLVCRYAEHCLGNFDAKDAEWAARQGLRVSPYDERLYRILLRAADIAGNPAGVEAVMAELVRLVADEVEPFDAIHPDTADLYRALSRRPLTGRRR
jgi:DNA-binding SARP family transcriptional activator